MSSDYQFSFCPELEDIIRDHGAVGRSGKTFRASEGLSSRNTLITLRNLCLTLEPERTMEIGLGLGGSCLAIAAAYRELGRSPKAQHVALDPFERQVWDDTGLLAIEQAGLDGYVEFRPSQSSVELPRLVASGAEFDLVYIDGSHLFEDVFVDFYYVARSLSRTGLVVFDDSSDHNVRKVLRFIRRNLRSAFEEIDLSPFRSDRGRPIKYRLAKLMGKVQITAFRRVGPVARKWNARFTDF